jgi:hypothetical protein
VQPYFRLHIIVVGITLAYYHSFAAFADWRLQLPTQYGLLGLGVRLDLYLPQLERIISLLGISSRLCHHISQPLLSNKQL